MERRSQSRFDRKRFTTSDPARIEVLSLDHRNPQIEATLIDVSNHGLGFSLEQKVEPGSALKIEIRDAMVLGEAVHCTPSGAAFVLGVKVDQMLSPLDSLLGLNRVLINEEENSRRERAQDTSLQQKDIPVEKRR